MTSTVKEQVKTGLRLAGGIVLFVLLVLLLAYGLDAVWSAAVPSGHLVWGAWIGWSELLVAAVLIPLTVHLWLQFFAGCVGFAFLKSVVVIFAGKDWYPPHAFFSRLEATEMAIFFGATLALMIRFAKERPTLLDRIAITIYLFFFFGYRNNAHFSLLGAGSGLTALFFAWCAHRWKWRPGVLSNRRAA
jgi:hypothetical protein